MRAPFFETRSVVRIKQALNAVCYKQAEEAIECNVV